MGRSTTPLTQPINFDSVVFVGIDYHKRFSMLCLGDSKGKIVGFHKLYNDRNQVREFFGRIAKARCAIESCRGFEWLVDMLQEAGIEVNVCNPRKVKLIVETRCKNDKVDSKTLMELLAKNFLPISYIASREERRLREILRWRAALVHSAVRVKCAITCLIDKENLGLNHKDMFTSCGRAFLESAPVSADHRALLDKQLEMLAVLEERIQREDKWARAETKGRPQAARLQTIPGFGPLTSLIFLAEVGDVNRFKRASQVASYAGLVTSTYDSADTHRTGRITKQGSTYLRCTLIQCAWAAVKSHSYFRAHFGRIAFRRGRNKAITAVARKLCEIGFHVLRGQANFDESKLSA